MLPISHEQFEQYSNNDKSLWFLLVSNVLKQIKLKVKVEKYFFCPFEAILVCKYKQSQMTNALISQQKIATWMQAMRDKQSLFQKEAIFQVQA